MNEPVITVPPEWATQKALWVGWPHLREEWGGALEGARAEIAVFVAVAARYVPVCVACGSDEAQATATAALGQLANVSLITVPAGDIWLRDTGPIIGHKNGAYAGLVFQFNGWGGKYVMPGDTETAQAMCAYEQIVSVSHDFILEGGAIDVDGTGRSLTTRECLLNANRNGWQVTDAELALKRSLGVSEIIWLERGLLGDHTDGHVDNVARFVAPGHVLCQSAAGANDPQAERLEEIETVLRKCGLRVSTVPSPGRIVDDEAEMMPASHMNFVLTNGAVMLPVYETVHSVEAARGLGELFPDRDVICLPAKHILAGGGSFHCMTREIPASGDRK